MARHAYVKCLAFYHPDDDPWLKGEQGRALRGLYDAARRLNRELLIEIICGRHGHLDAATTARALRDLYELGIRPDWWKLEPQASPAAWQAIGETIEKYDRWCRGVVMLGLEAPEAELARAFRLAAGAPVVKGFAVGRTIFAETAKSVAAKRHRRRGGRERHGGALSASRRHLADRAFHASRSEARDGA